MYYPNTITEVKNLISDVSIHIKPERADLSDYNGNPVPLSHLLWMCKEIEKMDTLLIDDALKSGRWIGWILAHIETRFHWTNIKSRSLIHKDREMGFDKPHQK